MQGFSVSAVAAVLDFAVLKPNQTSADIHSAAALCGQLSIGCLCVQPIDVCRAARLLHKQKTVVASVVGFPHGANATAIKVHEARIAIEDGAREREMVLALQERREGDKYR